MSAFSDILKNIIEADRILDANIQRMETQLVALNTKLVLMQLQLDALRQRMGPAGTDANKWDAIRAPAGVVEGGPKTVVVGNSDPKIALPSDEELLAGLDRIIR